MPPWLTKLLFDIGEAGLQLLLNRGASHPETSPELAEHVRDVVPTQLAGELEAEKIDAALAALKKTRG